MSVDDFPDSDNVRALAPIADGIVLWWSALDRPRIETDALAACLSSAELARADRFGTEALRRRWIAGRASLRIVLGRTLGIAPAAVPIQRGARGRPELAGSGVRLDFNVSHTQGIALIGTAAGLPPDTRIGVDIEREDRDVGAERLARKFLTRSEQSAVAGLPSSELRHRFLRYWTCKEAMSKATGDGLMAPFGRLDVELDPRPRLVDGPAPYLPSHWALHAVPVPAPYLATVAVWRGGGPSYIRRP